MENTIQVGASIIVDEDAYRETPPERTDIVLYRDPRPGAAADTLFVKRIIGLGGEVLEIRDSKVMIDGVALAEPYLKPGSQMPIYGPELIPPGHFFVMGDNRKLSLDSRRVGPIPDALILGKVVQISNP
ncbi:MAG: hypothetical protein BMS9Abin07_2064 [Acidimicrobiia bacterium]|nr:MAG: hypothetical protein BMS9Abin07_2064 [Acidimicrobiia bacterium]